MIEKTEFTEAERSVPAKDVNIQSAGTGMTTERLRGWISWRLGAGWLVAVSALGLIGSVAAQLNPLHIIPLAQGDAQ